MESIVDKDDCLKKFGENLKQQRITAGLSQEELAHRAGIDRSYLGSIERGEHNVALMNILKIAKSLEIHPQRLFDFEI